MTIFNYISITQGGCGIISPDQYSTKGFYTDGVESCAAIVYKCKNGAAFCHDSGQMRESELIAIIDQLGPVREILIANGTQTNAALFDSRIKILSKKLSFLKSPRIFSHPSPSFSVKYSVKQGFQKISTQSNEQIVKSPYEIKRDAINKLTDLFARPRAQDVRVDIQYTQNEFTDVPEIDPPVARILQLIEEQAQFFFLNIKALKQYSTIAELKLPIALIDFFERHTVDQLPDFLNTQDFDKQTKLHSEYIGLNIR
ncbi:hypothetical protein [Chromatium okenii]|jgi:hypothetical protein|nr:hypothetical protein [Chromatium okenii]MBV5308220.1 hypothetical protein [Chromatium okenii]